MGRTANRLVTMMCGLAAMIVSPYMSPATAGSADGTAVRPPFPDLMLIDGSGVSFHLARYFGQAIIVLEFGASTCGPCVSELTYLDRLQGDFRRQPLIVLAVSEDGGGIAAVQQFEKRQKISFLKPFADPDGSAAQALGISGLPTTFVIDRQGRLAMTVQGPQVWDNAAYEARFRLLLSQP